MSASWSSCQERDDRFLNQFFQTVRGRTDGGKLVVMIRKAPGHGRPRPAVPGEGTVLSVPELQANRQTDVRRRPRDQRSTAVVGEFAKSVVNVRYFEANRFVCPQGPCSAHAADGKPLYYDPSHLTAKASAELGLALMDAGGVPAVFACPPGPRRFDSPAQACLTERARDSGRP